MEVANGHIYQMPESLEHVWSAVLVLFQDVITSPLYMKSVAATTATFTALSLWFEVIIMLSKPPLTIYWRWQISLSRTGLYIETGIVLSLLFIYFLRRWLRKKQFLKRISNFISNWKRKIKTRYRNLMMNLERKSRVVALALPHLIFFGVAYLFVRLFPETANHFASDSLVEKMVILIRVGFTFVAIYDAEQLTKSLNEASNKSSQSSVIYTSSEPPPSSLRNRLWSMITPSRQANMDSAVDTTTTATATATALNTGEIPTTPHRTGRVVASNKFVVEDNQTAPSASPSVISSTFTRMFQTPPPCTPGSNKGSITLSSVNDNLRSKRTSDEVQNTVRTNLMHWIVFALFLCVQRFATSLPFIGTMSKLVGADERLRLFYAILLLWLQLPIGAVQVAYDYLVPLLESHAPMLFSPSASRSVNPTTKKTQKRNGHVINRSSRSSEVGDDAQSGSLQDETQERVAQLGTLLRLLSMTGVLSVERADMIREICSEGWVLLGSMFFLTPPMFTQYGVLLCGLIYPAGCSAYLVTDRTLFSLPSQIRWLKYWSVYALILHGGHELESCGLWRFMIFANYFHLALVIYLQLPYFRGAIKGHALVLKGMGYAVAALLGSSAATCSSQVQEGRSSSIPTLDGEGVSGSGGGGVSGDGSATVSNSEKMMDKTTSSNSQLRNRRNNIERGASGDAVEARGVAVPSAAAAIQAEFEASIGDDVILDSDDAKKNK